MLASNTLPEWWVTDRNPLSEAWRNDEGQIGIHVKELVNGPIPWLIEYAYLRKSPKLAEELLKKLKDAELTEQFTAAEALSHLYFCAPDEFTAAANRLGQLELRDQSAPGVSTDWIYLSQVRKVRPDVAAHFDIANYSLQQLQDKGN